jgi:hypothetical protein
MVARLQRLLDLEPDGAFFCELLGCLPWPWGPELSQAAFDAIARRVRELDPSRYWVESHWLEALELAARRMHAGGLEGAAAWAEGVGVDEGLAHHARFASFYEVVGLRREMARRLCP